MNNLANQNTDAATEAKSEVSYYDKMKVNLRQKQFMLSRKLSTHKIKPMKEIKKGFFPTQMTEEQRKAIVEIGFNKHPELSLQNPFLQKCEERVAQQEKIKKLDQQLKVNLKIDVDKETAYKMTESSLLPHLAITFYVSIPFKDSLLNTGGISPSQPVSITYPSVVKKGFMFSPSMVKSKVEGSSRDKKTEQFDEKAHRR